MGLGVGVTPHCRRKGDPPCPPGMAPPPRPHAPHPRKKQRATDFQTALNGIRAVRAIADFVVATGQMPEQDVIDRAQRLLASDNQLANVLGDRAP